MRKGNPWNAILFGNLKRELIGLVIAVCAVAVVDLIFKFPAGYWRVLSFICMIIPTSFGAVFLSDELGKNTIFFLEYLPLRRSQIWRSTFITGLTLSFVLMTPLLMVRGLADFAPIAQSAGAFGESVRISAFAGQQFASCPRSWILLAGLSRTARVLVQ